ncbi:TMEM175 family protein [Microbacterium sp. Marseille-Q6965]|uniref:TMEM175 family protein n=1 Tax=Microbacterium sp. Marseille-Q6965 TaxID=2965072 RepID=UPI0021B744E0|nr:TMEM175 family protein [Microbacterium sp. Marseille-Q6965]
MIRQRRHPAATQATRRVEAFTDGVFAIAATLLVLDLTTHSLGRVDSDARMWVALGAMTELFGTFVLSFVLLCLLWMVHVQQFERIARVDAVMVWLNSVRLLFIVLVPFATGLTTEYSEYLAGRLAMPTVFFLAILCSWLQWRWAMRRRDVMLPELTAAGATASGRGALSALLIAAAVVLLSPAVGSIAFALFFLDTPLTRLLAAKRA